MDIEDLKIEREARIRYPQYPDNDAGGIEHDPLYEDKQDYFIQGAEWAIEQMDKL